MTNPLPVAASLEMAAPPERVWEVLADPTRMPEFSPELRKAFLIGRPGVSRLMTPILGGAAGHDAELAEGLASTLGRIRAAVEGG